MFAAIVEEFGRPPRWKEVAEPQPGPDEVRVRVRAAAASQLVRSHAAGKHYSSPKTVPFGAGLEGVGELEDGTFVYFVYPRSGAMAEFAVVRRNFTVTLPPGIDVVKAAASANPGMSSWAALTRRARLQAGETVLINGATGVSGGLAIRVARYLGAGFVVATGRHVAGVDADLALPLDGDLRRAIEDHPVRIVLDYLWGPPARSIIDAIAARSHDLPQPRIRFVQIGNVAGAEMPLPAAALRSTGLELMGSGFGSVPAEEMVTVCGEFLTASAAGGLDVDATAVPMADVERAWTEDTAGSRYVFTVNRSFTRSS